MGMSKLQFLNRLSVELRIAKLEDYDEIKRLYGDYSGENMKTLVNLDKDVVDASIMRMIEHGAIILPCIGKKVIGFIAGYLQECHFSNDVMFSLMYFYIHKDFRDRSGVVMKGLQALVEKNTQATMFVISCPAFEGYEKLERYYQMSGLQKLETHYFKRLKESDAKGK